MNVIIGLNITLKKDKWKHFGNVVFKCLNETEGCGHVSNVFI